MGYNLRDHRARSSRSAQDLGWTHFGLSERGMRRTEVSRQSRRKADAASERRDDFLASHAQRMDRAERLEARHRLVSSLLQDCCMRFWM